MTADDILNLCAFFNGSPNATAACQLLKARNLDRPVNFSCVLNKSIIS